ncbi:TetR/AcrR family transcriptional regulator [Polycladidibacter hongkongensis]|uniref:TetR/AcrR family transcriptional regulator n=1 Tax=Polycladidibacter hongkongensis TaxID=1647556 RepID=UPI0008372BF2|nr:helix-turn-helix domain-containing protein [Pseudovibrio hongkongensis]
MAAEQLLSERGVASTSVRMITDRAGANVAAINYHFGSKEELIKQILFNRLCVLTDMRAQRLHALEAGGRMPQNHEILRAYVEPLVVQGVSRQSGEVLPFIILFRHVLSDPSVARKVFGKWSPPAPILKMLNYIAKNCGVEKLTSFDIKYLMLILNSVSMEVLLMFAEREQPIMEDEHFDMVVDQSVAFLTGGITSYFETLKTAPTTS